VRLSLNLSVFFFYGEKNKQYRTPLRLRLILFFWAFTVQTGMYYTRQSEWTPPDPPDKTVQCCSLNCEKIICNPQGVWAGFLSLNSVNGRYKRRMRNLTLRIFWKCWRDLKSILSLLFLPYVFHNLFVIVSLWNNMLNIVLFCEIVDIVVVEFCSLNI
jgi:hypothetical protein